MSGISGNDLRTRFLDFFEKKEHERVASAPILPQSDPTLLFVNAGMVPFKDLFTGKETRSYARATSSQKCVRAGGKHNDLENVGRTARHHTFFEMLGNFSFGDYFKEDACKYAWEFLTKELGLEESKLSVTVFGGDENFPADEEAERIWHDIIGVAKENISRCGAKDNFWSMGDTGPCGPCSEIHYDRGQVEGSFGGDDPEGDRILEVWNLVFMQFERAADGSVTPLPKPSIDTGMGLERLAMVMNGLASNYDTDLLRPIITICEEKSGKKYTSSDGDADVAMRVIADHARTTCFLIADGITPGNGKREYVVRRIMRRAILHGADRLGFDELFFHEACAKVIEIFGEAYPEVKRASELIDKMVRLEEETFRKTLARGLLLFQDMITGLSKGDTMDGAGVFDLKQTYGFPPDLSEVLAKERGLAIDWSAFQKAEEIHAQASAGDLGLEGIPDAFKEVRQKYGETKYLGHATNEATGSVVSIIAEGKPVNVLETGGRAQLILDATPFYGESGGQVGDTGFFSASGDVKVEITDTAKMAGLHVHTAIVREGKIALGDKLEGAVDGERLWKVRRNHSATHLLHKALRDVLGTHVTQKGSLVDERRLRFDFSHFEAMKDDEISEVENRVNAWVMENIGADIGEMSYDDAQEKGAMALFGEKYGDEVRVVGFGPSVELCGGVHVNRTGDIGLFKITSEGPLAAGVRRIEAVSGTGALKWAQTQERHLEAAAVRLGVMGPDVPSKVQKLQEELKATEKELKKFKQKASTEAAGQAVDGARDIGGIRVLAQRIDGVAKKDMRDYADKLRDKLGSGVVAVGAPNDKGKVSLLVALTPDLIGKLHAGQLVREMAALVGGKGGGKEDLAQAGGDDVSKLDEAINSIYALVENAG